MTNVVVLVAVRNEIDLTLFINHKQVIIADNIMWRTIFMDMVAVFIVTMPFL